MEVFYVAGMYCPSAKRKCLFYEYFILWQLEYLNVHHNHCNKNDDRFLFEFLKL